jgi:hypothetical protein
VTGGGDLTRALAPVEIEGAELRTEVREERTTSVLVEAD